MSDQLDQETLEKIRALGGDALLTELVGVYLENTPARLEALGSGMRDGDLAQVEKAAHSIRSSSVSLGARTVADEAAVVERMAQGRINGDLEASVAGLETMLRKLIETLHSDFDVEKS